MPTLQELLQDQLPTATQDKVGLAVYGLQNFGGEDNVTASEIATLFNINNISMGESAIAAHLHNLRENGLLLESDHGYETGYYLSSDGMKRFERISKDEVGSPPPEEISGNDLSEYYEQLYERTGSILTELRQQKENTVEWRQKTRKWRIISIISWIISVIISIGTTLIL